MKKFMVTVRVVLVCFAGIAFTGDAVSAVDVADAANGTYYAYNS